MPPLERGHNVKKYIRQEQQLAQAAAHARQLHEPESIARWHERHLIRSASLSLCNHLPLSACVALRQRSTPLLCLSLLLMVQQIRTLRSSDARKRLLRQSSPRLSLSSALLISPAPHRLSRSASLTPVRYSCRSENDMHRLNEKLMHHRREQLLRKLASETSQYEDELAAQGLAIEKDCDS